MLKDRLINLRKQRKLSQQGLADRLHISRSTYAQYEIGRRMPDYETLKKIADFFDVSIDYLLGIDTGQKTKYIQNSNQQNYRDYDFIIQAIKEHYPNVDITDPVVRKKLIKAIDFVLDDYEQTYGRKQ